ncbi:hypothetical protein L1049_014746 [Liquidambar formosana]|uniref:Uncharacterized protein n=1 Tax=Liquidambar formosana TaxID=63359 RepID=A0AAP0S2R5_LIQFO
MDSKPLHIFYFPFIAPGHMIPTIDMARLFAFHGVKATIITTHLNAPLFSKTIEKDRQLGSEISIRTVKFPSAEAGLPEDCENLNSITSHEMSLIFYKALSLLQQPLEQLLEECRPDCLVADMMFPWATEVAGRFGIPRLVFHGTSFFALCVSDGLMCHQPYKNIASDSEAFVVPGLPDQIKMTMLHLPNYVREGSKNELSNLMDQSLQAELTSYGIIMNSFYELEPAYTEHYRKVMMNMNV